MWFHGLCTWKINLGLGNFLEFAFFLFFFLNFLFPALSFNIYLIRDWIFHWFLKRLEFYCPSILSYSIINIHSLIQFAFDKITPVSQSGRKSCMLTRVDSGHVFWTFFVLYFFLRFNPSIFCLLKIEVIVLSFICFLRYQTRSFNIWFFLKLIFFLILISSFGIWLIRNRSLCFFFIFLSMGLSQSYINDHRVSEFIWFDSGFFYEQVAYLAC
jgi:hypothetical protein